MSYKTFEIVGDKVIFDLHKIVDNVFLEDIEEAQQNAEPEYGSDLIDLGDLDDE